MREREKAIKDRRIKVKIRNTWRKIRSPRREERGEPGIMGLQETVSAQSRG